MSRERIIILNFSSTSPGVQVGSILIGKQNKGLSIGGFLSSMLAILLANYAEHSTLIIVVWNQIFQK